LSRAISGNHADATALIYRIDHGGKKRDFPETSDGGGPTALRPSKSPKGTHEPVWSFNSVVLESPGSPPAILTLCIRPPLAHRGSARKGRGLHAVFYC